MNKFCVVCETPVSIEDKDPDDDFIYGELKVKLPNFTGNPGDKIGPLCMDCHICLEAVGAIE